MNLLFILEILFFVMAIIATILFIINVFFLKNQQPNYEELYKFYLKQEEKNLQTLKINNKKINEIESKILVCKKKLGIKLFKNK